MRYHYGMLILMLPIQTKLLVKILVINVKLTQFLTYLKQEIFNYLAQYS